MTKEEIKAIKEMYLKKAKDICKKYYLTGTIHNENKLEDYIVNATYSPIDHLDSLMNELTEIKERVYSLNMITVK